MTPQNYFSVPVKEHPNAVIEVVIKADLIVVNLYLQKPNNPCIPDCTLILKPLLGIRKNSYSTDVFSDKEFFQHTFKSNHQGLRLGHVIHDFIIENKRSKFWMINDLYSTNDHIDSQRHQNLVMSTCAVKFWENRIKLEKAAFLQEIGRYKITW